jgi:hypothetical protein
MNWGAGAWPLPATPPAPSLLTITYQIFFKFGQIILEDPDPIQVGGCEIYV